MASALMVVDVQQGMFSLPAPLHRGEEVVRRVVVQRRLLAQAPEDGIGVGADVDVVRVVVDVCLARPRHLCPVWSSIGVRKR